MIRLLPIVTALGLVLGSDVFAQQRFTIPMVVDFENPQYEPFHEFLERQLSGSIVDGQLVAEPDGDPGSCRLSTTVLDTEGVRAAHVEVDVRVDSDRGEEPLLIGAGLMIRHSEEDGIRFLALLATNDGYDIVAFDQGALTQQIRSTLAGRESGGPLKLAAREVGGGAEFFVDGRSVGSLSDGRISGIGLGLIHCGSGRYVFDNWGLNARGDVGFQIASETEYESGVGKSPARPPPVPAASGPPPLPGAGGAPPEEPRPTYWYEMADEPHGPVTLDELSQLVAAGQISGRTLIWKEGLTDWIRAESYQGLAFQ